MFEQVVAESYGRWIEYNAEVTAVNDVLITVTVLLVIDAFIYLLAGIGIAVIAPPLTVVTGGFLALTVGLLWASRRVFHMDHLNRGGPKPPFEGIRLSKGASRRDVICALIWMLRPSNETNDD